MEKTVKDIIIEKYGTINNFVALKLQEFNGKLPCSREYIYRLINHGVDNPGIMSLNKLAELTGIDKEIIYEEYGNK